MQLILILIVILAGMGLSVEAGIVAPLTHNVGELWASFSIFSIGSALSFFLMLFFAPRDVPSIFKQPNWTQIGGLLGVAWLVILAFVSPKIGIALTMVGVLSGQVGKSLLIDHFGWFGSPHLKIDKRRLIALGFIIMALILMVI